MEQIGLEAVFDMQRFDQGIASYMSGVKRAGDVTDDTQGRFGKAFDAMGGKVLHVAGLMTGAFVAATGAAAVAVGAFVGGGIKGAMDLESQMGAIAAVMGETKDAVGPLKDLILDLGLDPSLKVNAQEAADAIEKLASNGLTMSQIMDGAAKSTVLLANSTAADFDTAAAIATDTMALFNIEAGDMMEAVNGITGVTVASKFSINDYRLALAQAGGVASATGVSFEDFNTSITGIANYFASGSDAGTSFKTMLQRLIPSTNAAAEAMGDIGLTTINTQAALQYLSDKGVQPTSSDMYDLYNQAVGVFYAANDLEVGSEAAAEKFSKWAMETGLVQSAFYDANGQMRDMDEISSLLNESLSGLTEQEKSKALSTIFGTDAMRAAVGMAEQGEVAYTDQSLAAKELGVSYDSLTEAMEGGLTKFEALQIQLGQTDAAEAAKLRMDNFKGSLEILQGTIETVGLKIGFAFLPMLKEMADRLSEFVSNNADAIIGFFEGFAGAVEQLVAGTPTDFPWEDIFPPGLAEIAYGVSEVIEGVSKALTDFHNGAMSADYPWETVFPGTLGEIINFIADNMDILTGALGGVATLLASAGIAAAFSGITAAMAALVSPMGLLIIGAAALGAAWNTNFLGIKDATLAVIEPINNFIAVVMDAGLNSIETREALTLFPEALQGLVGGFIDTVSNITNYIAAIQDAGVFSIEAREALTLFPEALQNLIGGIVETVASVTNYIDIIKDAGLFSTESGEALGLLLESFGKLVSGVGDLLGTWTTTLLGWANEVGETLLSIDYVAIGKSIVDFIIKGWSAAVSAATPSITAFTDSIKKTIEDIDWKAVGQAVLNGIKDGIELAKSGALAVLTAIATAWKNNFGDSVQNWAQVGKDILGRVQAGIESAKSAALAVITEIALAVKNRYMTPEGFSWDKVGSDLQNLIKTGLQSAANAAGGIVSTALTVATAIKDAFTTLSWEEVGTLIIGMVRDGLASAAKAADGILNTVKQVGLDAVEALKNINWEEVGRTIARFLKDGFKAIATGVGGLIPTATEVANSAKESFLDVNWLQLGKDILTAIGTGVKAIAYGAGGLILIVAEIVKGFTEELFGVNWNDQGVDIMTAIDSGVESTIGKLMETVRTIPAGIKKIFTEMVETWKNIGRDIVNGIGAGLLGARDALMQKAQDLANSLPGWVKQVLGISSPSKVFMEIGKNVVEGLVVGMENNAGRLQQASQALAGDMIPWFKLATMQFSAPTDFTERLLGSVSTLRNDLEPELARRQKLMEAIRATEDFINRGQYQTENQRQNLLNWIQQARREIDGINGMGGIQVFDRIDRLTFLNKEAEEFTKRMESQIGLLTEAKKLGIDVRGVQVGDFSISGLETMADIERQILDIKKRQLLIQADAIKNQAIQTQQFEYERQIIASFDDANNKAKNVLALMEGAAMWGIDLASIIPKNLDLLSQTTESERVLLKLETAIAGAVNDNLEAQIKGMVEGQKRLRGLSEAMKQLQPIMDQMNVDSAFGQRYKATVLDPILRALEDAAGIDSERLRLINEYKIAAEKLLEINKKEEQLGFLQEQLDLIKTIQDQDLVGGASLLEGLQFGINASIDDLLTLTNRVLNAMIEETKDELGIHSPSSVFAEIGTNMMQGLAAGIQKGMVQPFNSLRSAMVERGAVSTRTLNFAMGGVNIYNGMDEVMFESKVLRIVERAI